MASKPYVYVRDLVDALNFGARRCGTLEASKFNVINVAPDAATSLRFIVNDLFARLGFTGRTKISYGDTVAGWPGDVPQSRMDSTKLRKAGGSLPRTSDEALSFAISRILEWLAVRGDAGDDLNLLPDASPGKRK